MRKRSEYRTGRGLCALFDTMGMLTALAGGAALVLAVAGVFGRAGAETGAADLLSGLDAAFLALLGLGMVGSGLFQILLTKAFSAIFDIAEASRRTAAPQRAATRPAPGTTPILLAERVAPPPPPGAQRLVARR